MDMYNTLDFEGLSYMLDPTILNRDTSISLYEFESDVSYSSLTSTWQQSWSQSYQTPISGHQWYA